MLTKIQRIRVAELLDGLACQRWFEPMANVLRDEDLRLAFRAYGKTAYQDGIDWWRPRYAEAAQLLREGAVK